jgi:aspartokinase-like uncharacterized kinase
MNCAVVKLGGSTAYDARLSIWVAALAGSALPLVIVPGGGPFANQVREAQKRMGFSDEAAHAMAILAMDQFGHFILDRDDSLVPTQSFEDIERALDAGRIPVWLPSSLAIPAPDIRASWDMTSDSIAAWLAGKVGANGLLLIKQTSAFSKRDCITSLTAKGILDAGFSSMLPTGVDLRLARPKDAAAAGMLLCARILPGTKVQLASRPVSKAG